MDKAKRELIEKAVVKLVDWSGNNDCLYQNKGNDRYEFADSNRCYHTMCSTWELMSAFWRLVCTREEFEQVKAEMQNKPSWKSAPEWANWLVQYSSGDWVWYEKKPKHNGLYWGNGESKGQFSKHGKVIGDWRNTLEKRPQETEQPMKYEYGVEYECNGEKPEDLPDDVLIKATDEEGAEEVDKAGNIDFAESLGVAKIVKFKVIDEHYKPKSNWHERGELPPVGEICRLAEDTEFLNLQSGELTVKQRGEKVIVTGTSKRPDNGAINVVLMCCDDLSAGSCVGNHEFLCEPLRNERDELIDYAINKINKCSDEVAETARVATISQLGMLGMLKYED